MVDEPQNSVTRETLESQVFDYNIGFGVTEVQSNGAGTAHTFFSTIDHGLNRVINIGIASDRDWETNIIIKDLRL